MNKHCFRLIFSKVYGFFIPVAEITRSYNRAGQRSALLETAVVATPPLSVPFASLIEMIRFGVAARRQLYVLFLIPGLATAADQVADVGGPNIKRTENQTPVIEILTPDASGLSHNRFSEFNANDPGVIFNNSQENGTAGIGGSILNNPNLTAGAARAILVDVTGGHSSRLAGTLEVFGQRADLLIANPNGIVLNGVTTLNASSLTTTTGRPVFNSGALEFIVEQGKVTIDGTGVDTRGLSYYDVVARAIELKGSVSSPTQETDILLAAGLNTYTADSRTVHQNQANANGAPVLAISGAEAGSMYGRNVSLISTESGVGVQHAGFIRSAQDLVITANGDIALKSLDAGRNIVVQSRDNLTLQAGSIEAAGRVALESGQMLTVNQHVKGDALTLKAKQVLLNTTRLNAISLSAVRGLSITASGDILNSGSSLLANEKIRIKADGDFYNQANSAIYTAGELAIDVNDFINQGNSFINVGQLTVSASGNVQNTSDSDIDSLRELAITVGGEILNDAAQLKGGAITLTAKGDVNNVNNALIHSRGIADPKTEAIDPATGKLRVDAGGTLRNDSQSQLRASDQLTVDAHRVINHDGALIQAKGVSLTTRAGLTNDKAALIKAQDRVDIRAGGAVTNSASQILGADIAVDTVGDLLNQAGALINATHDVDLDVLGAFINDAAQVLGTTVELKADSVRNDHAGRVSANTLNLTAAGAVLNQGASSLDAKGALTVTAKGAITNDNAVVIGKQVTISGASLSNTQHGVIKGHQLKLDTLGAVDNNTKASLVATGSAVISAKGAFSNDDAVVNAPTLTITADSVSNSKGGNLLGTSIKVSADKDIRNDSQAVIKGTSSVVLSTSQGSITNTGAAVINAPVLTVKGVNVSNLGKAQILGGNIAIQAANLFTSDGGSTIKGAQIAVDTKHFVAADSDILATDHIDIKTEDFANTAKITSKNTATLTLKAGKDLVIDGAHRALMADQLLTLNAHHVRLNSELNNPGHIHINASGNVANDAAIIAGKGLQIKAQGDIDNLSNRLIWSAQNMVLEAGGSITNWHDALLMGMQEVFLKASHITNLLANVSAGSDLWLDALTVTNQGGATGGLVRKGSEFTHVNHRWHHSWRWTQVLIDFNLPVFGSNITANQAIMESGGNININQRSGKDKRGTVRNNDSLMAATADLNVDGDFYNTSTVATLALVDYLKTPSPIVVTGKDKLAIQTLQTRYNSLWDLLNEVLSQTDDWHKIFVAYGYNDRNTLDGLKTNGHPLFNQVMSAALGPDWKAMSRDVLVGRWNAFKRNNGANAPAMTFYGDKPAEISTGGKFNLTGGRFHNGGLQKAQQTVTVVVGDQTVDTIAGDFDASFNHDSLFNTDGTFNLPDLVAALNPPSVLKKLIKNNPLFILSSDLQAFDLSALGWVVVPLQEGVKPAPTQVLPLFETRIAYIDQTQFYGSQYFFDSIGYHSDRTISVIGDAFFDNQLITQTIQAISGNFFAVDRQLSGAALTQSLMDNAGVVAPGLGLQFGVPLTAEQYSHLTTDIVWYEPITVEGVTVLAPKVYLAKNTLAKIAADKSTGALVRAGGDVNIAADAGGVSNVNGLIRSNGNVNIESEGAVVNQSTGTTGGGILAGKKLAIDAKGDVSNIGSTLMGNDVDIKSEGDFVNTVRMGYDEQGSLIVKERGWIVGGEEGGISIDAAGDVHLTSAGMVAKDITVQAGGDLLSDDVHEVNSSFTFSSTGNDPLGIGMELGAVTRTETSVGANSVGSFIQAGADGGTLVMKAGKNLTLKGGSYGGDYGDISAQGDVTTLTGQDFAHTETTMLSEGLSMGARTGIAGMGVAAEFGPGGASTGMVTGKEAEGSDAGRLKSGKSVLDSAAGANIGYERIETKDTKSTITNTNAKLTFGSSINLQAEGQVDIGGVDIKAVKDGKAGDISISGSEVVSTKFEDVVLETSSRKESFVGITGTVESSVVDAVNNAKTLEDKQAQGMTLDPGMVALQGVGDATNLVFNDLGAVTAKVGAKHTETYSSSKSRSENINTLTGNIKITSTKGDIRLTGVKLDGKGAGVELDSAGDVQLSSAKTYTASESSTHTHDITAFSVSASVAPTGAGVGTSLGYNGSLDETSSSGVSHQNSSIEGDNIVIKAKNDLTLVGATVKGADIALDVGGNTRVESVQDTYEENHNVANWGTTLGAAITTQSIVAPVVGLNGGSGHDYDRSALTGEQSGISASGKLTVNVAGDLSLKGAHLISASDQGELNVGGVVTAEQLHDSRHKDGGSGGGGGGIGSTGLASVDIAIERVDQVHYEATQNATIAGVKINAGKGVQGPVNTDKDNTLTVSRDKRIAGTSVSMTLGIADMKEAVDSKRQKPGAGDDGPDAKRIDQPPQMQARERNDGVRPTEGPGNGYGVDNSRSQYDTPNKPASAPPSDLVGTRPTEGPGSFTGPDSSQPLHTPSSDQPAAPSGAGLGGKPIPAVDAPAGADTGRAQPDTPSALPPASPGSGRRPTEGPEITQGWDMSRSQYDSPSKPASAAPGEVVGARPPEAPGHFPGPDSSQPMHTPSSDQPAVSPGVGQGGRPNTGPNADAGSDTGRAQPDASTASPPVSPGTGRRPTEGPEITQGWDTSRSQYDTPSTPEPTPPSHVAGARPPEGPGFFPGPDSSQPVHTPSSDQPAAPSGSRPQPDAPSQPVSTPNTDIAGSRPTEGPGAFPGPDSSPSRPTPSGEPPAVSPSNGPDSRAPQPDTSHDSPPANPPSDKANEAPGSKYDSRVIVKVGSDPVTDQAAQRLQDKHPNTAADMPTPKYDSRVVVQVGNDAKTQEAASNLAGKHPNNTVLVERGADGALHPIKGDPSILWGKTKVAFVGHGDGTGDGVSSLGGVDANQLAKDVVELPKQVAKEGATPIHVEKVALVGCDTGTCTANNPSYRDKVEAGLKKLGGPTQVKGYRDRIDVSPDGRKQYGLTEGGLMRESNDSPSPVSDRVDPRSQLELDLSGLSDSTALPGFWAPPNTPEPQSRRDTWDNDSNVSDSDADYDSDDDSSSPPRPLPSFDDLEGGPDVNVKNEQASREQSAGEDSNDSGSDVSDSDDDSFSLPRPLPSLDDLESGPDKYADYERGAPGQSEAEDASDSESLLMDIETVPIDSLPWNTGEQSEPDESPPGAVESPASIEQKNKLLAAYGGMAEQMLSDAPKNSPLTQAEIMGIGMYTNGYYQDINTALRSGAELTPGLQVVDELMQSGLPKLKTDEVKKSYRGSRYPGLLYPDSNKITDAGYSSTSTDVNIAKDFLHSQIQPFSRELTMFGKSGVDVAPYSMEGYEKEILYNRGTLWNVLFKSNDGRKVVLEEQGAPSDQGRRYHMDLQKPFLKVFLNAKAGADSVANQAPLGNHGKQPESNEALRKSNP